MRQPFQRLGILKLTWFIFSGTLWFNQEICPGAEKEKMNGFAASLSVKFKPDSPRNQADIVKEIQGLKSYCHVKFCKKI